MPCSTAAVCILQGCVNGKSVNTVWIVLPAKLRNLQAQGLRKTCHDIAEISLILHVIQQ